MGFFSRSSTSSAMIPWENLESEQQLVDAINEKEVAVFLFKHSTRCSISTMAKSRLEREWQEPSFPFKLFYLDLLNYRSISAKIAELTGVEHQSPQLIVVQNGEVKYSDSHGQIAIQRAIENVNI